MPSTIRQTKNYLAPSQVADLLMVSPATVRLWASKGDLRSVQTPGGHRRYLRHEIERFAREKNLTLQLPKGDELRILIVDDDKLVTKYLERLMASFDEVVTTSANDGFRAGQLVQEFQPHVVLLDLLMPGLDGFDVCKRIKSDPTYKAVRIIAMTGFTTLENSQQALKAGADSCISKPIDTDELFSLLGLGQGQAVEHGKPGLNS